MIIYKIKSKSTSRVYIGQTKNSTPIPRWQGHKNDLKANRHGNKFLQAVYNKYGEDDLEYSIICKGDSLDHLNILEKRMIIRYHALATDKGFNLTEGGWDYKWSEKEKLRQSISRKGIKRGGRAKGTVVPKKQDGYAQSKEHRSKISLAHQKRFLKEGEELSYKIGQFDNNSNLLNTFNTAIEASLMTGVSAGNIGRCLRNLRKSAGKFIWKYLK